MALVYKRIFIIAIIVGALVSESIGRTIKKNSKRLSRDPMYRQQILQRRETTAVNFSRLVAMRLIYGLASLFGLRERVSGILNGAFVPPGADEDDYGFSLDDDDDGGDFFGGGDFFDGGGFFE